MVGHVDVASSIQHRHSEALEILLRQRIEGPLEALPDMLIILCLNVGVYGLTEDTPAEEVAQAGDLPGRRHSGTTGRAQLADQAPDLFTFVRCTVHAGIASTPGRAPTAM